MKRMMIILFAIGMTAMSSTSMAAMSTGRVRQETRFLTDKMAYELNLNAAQYNDAYEINYDFIYSIRSTMDKIVRGEEWALNEYYYYLDIRNDDLRWVLDDRQYRRFMRTDYFYRPVYASTNGWSFRVYIRYSNHALFYFGRPTHYTTYRGAHFRDRYDDVSFYRGRYDHTVYRESHSVRDDRVYHNNRRSDFGRVDIRPNSDRRSDGRDQIYSTRPNNDTPYRESNTRPSYPTNNRDSRRVDGDGNTSNRRENNSETIRRSNQDVKRDVDDRNNSRSEPSNKNRSNVNREDGRNVEGTSSRRSNSSNARSNESTRRSAVDAATPSSRTPTTR